MLRIRHCHFLTNTAVSNRMKPARQTRSMRCFSSIACTRALKSGAVFAEFGVVDDLSGDGCGARNYKPPASGRLEMTSTISAG